MCKDMLAVLRSAKPANWCSVEDDAPWETKLAEQDFARAFTAAMDARASVLAPALARRIDCRGYHRLLDVAGGSGIYACAIVAAHPQSSRFAMPRRQPTAAC